MSPSVFRALERWRLRWSTFGRQSKVPLFAQEMNLFPNLVNSIASASVLALSKHSTVRNIWHIMRVAASHARFDISVAPEARFLACRSVQTVWVFHLEAFFATEDDFVSSFESISRGVQSKLIFSDKLHSD